MVLYIHSLKLKIVLSVMIILSVTICNAGLNGIIETGRTIHNEDSRLSFFNFEFGYSKIFWNIEHTVYGGSRTWFYSDPGWDKPVKGQPFRNIYSLGYKIKYDMFYLKIDHFCNHRMFGAGVDTNWYSQIYSETMTSYIFGIEFKIK